MGELPATFQKNPRYITSCSEARSVMSDAWPSDLDFEPSKFVALYYYPNQADRILFTDDAVILGRDGTSTLLHLKDIKTVDYETSNFDGSKETNLRKKHDCICISMHSGAQHLVEVSGSSGHVRDALSIGKVIGTLKRRLEN